MSRQPGPDPEKMVHESSKDLFNLQKITDAEEEEGSFGWGGRIYSHPPQVAFPSAGGSHLGQSSSPGAV